mmetsp:Transcript_19708/g.21923  ORF Transcript_19708/g.21923 Transcript_19708/m.21923 type:complete len:133 (-) Transcript_19708:100-498(-)
MLLATKRQHNLHVNTNMTTSCSRIAVDQLLSPSPATNQQTSKKQKRHVRRWPSKTNTRRLVMHTYPNQQGMYSQNLQLNSRSNTGDGTTQHTYQMDIGVAVQNSHNKNTNKDSGFLVLEFAPKNTPTHRSAL